MAKTKNVRLVRRDENITLTREQIDAVGDASHDLECVLRSIAALTVDIRAIATPCENKAGVDLPAAILALCAFGQKANPDSAQSFRISSPSLPRDSPLKRRTIKRG